MAVSKTAPWWGQSSILGCTSAGIWPLLERRVIPSQLGTVGRINGSAALRLEKGVGGVRVVSLSKPCLSWKSETTLLLSSFLSFLLGISSAGC